MKYFFGILLILIIGTVVLSLQRTPETDNTVSSPPEPEPSEIVNIDTSPLRVTAPAAGSVVQNPIELRGEAPGNWFFEADAPVVVVNWDGLIIGESYIQAQGDWMTTDLVSFTGTVEYDLPADSYSASGTIIFQKANPSGLPEHDVAVEIPVQFSRESEM